MALPSLAELVAASGASAPAFFTKKSEVGDSITGNIVDVQTRQVLDIKTKKPSTWENGDPRMQVVVTLATDERSDDIQDDDGTRSVFIKFWGVQRKALLDALKAAGQEDLSIGQTFTATFTGKEKAQDKTLDDTKVFEYTVS